MTELTAILTVVFLGLGIVCEVKYLAGR